MKLSLDQHVQIKKLLTLISRPQFKSIFKNLKTLITLPFHTVTIQSVLDFLATVRFVDSRHI